MADRVHAYVERMQPSSANESLDRAVADPTLDQLPVGDNAVLNPRQLRDPSTWAV
jgi:hypothetical protein